ncbi:MAG: response regulator [Anaerolineales bacterium]
MTTEEKRATVMVHAVDQAVKQEVYALLSDADMRVHFTENGEIAERTEELLPDVILIDNDPRLNPFEVCRAIRTNRLLENIPVLLMCDRTDRDSRPPALSAGVDDFLEKPFEEVEVLSRLRLMVRLSAVNFLWGDLTRFTWMAENSKDGYLLLDRSGVVHYANQSAQQILNLAEDYLGLPFRQIVERYYEVQPTEVWENWSSTPESCFLVLPESPTARTTWIFVDALDTMVGSDLHRVVRLSDVTEKMTNYQDMRHFHTVVAHKLKTPMSIMYSNLSIIETRMDLLTPEEIKDFVQRAMMGVSRLSKEIKDILNLIDAPLTLSDGEPFALKDFQKVLAAACEATKVRNVAVFVSEKMQDKTIALTEPALEMILTELLENSQKFHPKHAPYVEITFEFSTPGFVYMLVADDGLTLTPEQLSWARLPYVQAEKDFTGELPGMGVGIPMVTSLVWGVGGNLWIRNRSDGPGIVVQLKIPLEETFKNRERPSEPFSNT